MDKATRTVTVRCELPNPGHKLRPGTTATINIHVPARACRLVTNTAGAIAERRRNAGQGRVLAVPDSSVIDTGGQTIVYREAYAGRVRRREGGVGPEDDRAGRHFVLSRAGWFEAGSSGLVTSGSFLVDAETRLNPAAGSIYFGGSGGGKSGPSNVTTVRPSTPEDPNAKITASLATLSDADRREAEAQKFCPILQSNKLGSMGPPIKLMLDGQPVFICCEGCRDEALANPRATLAKVKQPKAK